MAEGQVFNGGESSPRHLGESRAGRERSGPNMIMGGEGSEAAGSPWPKWQANTGMRSWGTELEKVRGGG